MDVLSLLFLKPFQQEAGSLGEHFGIYSLAFSAKQEIAWGEDTKEVDVLGFCGNFAAKYRNSWTSLSLWWKMRNMGSNIRSSGRLSTEEINEEEEIPRLDISKFQAGEETDFFYVWLILLRIDVAIVLKKNIDTWQIESWNGL